MKKIFTSVIKPFLPKYEVICTNYQLIPGHPVNKNQQRHTFEKGASVEALNFYGKVISSDLTKAMAPVEIALKKRGRVIQKVQIGPVEQLQKYKMVSVN
ncbi:hypothetical protein AAE02nite_17220 [Adhaeribacter aerolatus]|uniref:Uncharacterized protein n=1 Tax=Adhaeribacter aerolatus TaxID=670289 RepID=A0A512AWG5_9BACT|nr:hypothetical protein [Adhaeribacter aerolatus]GEO04058.1 hypothetical protein AAE02nite_17220 [Adhaeribacter aerolatus]